MRLLTIILLLTASPLIAADEKFTADEQNPSQCFLNSSGKGPDGIVMLKTSIKLAYLDERQPSIDENQETKPEALIWRIADKQPEIRLLGVSNGHRIIVFAQPTASPLRLATG